MMSIVVIIVIIFLVFFVVAFSRSETKHLDNHRRYRKAQERSFRGK